MNLRFVLLLTLLAAPPAALQGPKLPRANEVVEPRVSVSPQPARRGGAFELDVILRIRPGFHINANPASESYLIPTKIEAELPAGFQVRETHYPPGTLRKFKFSEEKLAVYEGTATLRVRVDVTSKAPLGQHKFSLALHYQACTEEVCLPPVKLPLEAVLNVTSAGNTAKKSP